ncbi:Hypothetical protein I596_1048 [Dokdonella koreensis DS-123]|uniref:Uncharacterized protein n=1 Tax=Dokdonella koreensis DS-123 TaxID=1300342 RepID=A0A160DS38_9GAMM|nr:Hypothetical protein I596_1048 [Dokdonella koreensis DS-123]
MAGQGDVGIEAGPDRSPHRPASGSDGGARENKRPFVEPAPAPSRPAAIRPR